MTKQDFIQLIQDRVAGGDVTNDTLQKYKYVTIAATINTLLIESASNTANQFGNSTFGFEYTALTGNYYLTLSPIPIGGAKGVKYVQDDCGNIYYGRKTVDQNVQLNNIMHMALPHFYVSGETLRFTAQPKGTSYTVYMTPDFVAMADDQEFTCDNIDTLVMEVIKKLKATNNEPTEVVNDTKPDKA